MKKFFIICLLPLCAFLYSAQGGTRANTSIQLPFNLKWLSSPNKVSKKIRPLRLKFRNQRWAFFEKENKKYWLYFDKKKKLRQITVLFRTMSDFVSYATKISTKYYELKLKTNYYTNSNTIIDIDSTISPKIVFLMK